MLFDLRGKRKRLIQVVYASLALLMGGGLVFFGIGSGAQGGLFDAFGGDSSGGDPQFDEQAKRIEAKLRTDPKNEQLLAQLVRARYTAGNSQVEFDPATGAPSLTEGAVQDFALSAEAWQRYIKLKPPNPNPNVASLAAKALFTGAATATSVSEFKTSINGAVSAQEIFAEARPNLGSYVTLAQYAYFAGDSTTAEEAGGKAKQQAPKAKRPAVEQALDQYRTQGEQIEKQIKAVTKFRPGGQGKEALQSPLGGLAGGGGGLSAPPTAP